MNGLDGTSPFENGFLHRFKSASSLNPDRELLNTYNKDESPFVVSENFPH